MALTEQEMVEILEGIAREGGNAAARIAAIRVLRDIQQPDGPSAAEGFAALDAHRGDELSQRRSTRFETKTG